VGQYLEKQLDNAPHHRFDPLGTTINTGIEVNYGVMVVAEDLGYSNGQSAYTALKSKLSDAITSNTLLSTLQSSSSPILKTVTSLASFTVSNPVIVIQRTTAPTPAPTKSPQSALASQLLFYEELPLYGKILLPVGAFIFLIAIAGMTYKLWQCCCSKETVGSKRFKSSSLSFIDSKKRRYFSNMFEYINNH